MFGKQLSLAELFNLDEPPWYGPVCLVVWEGKPVRASLSRFSRSLLTLHAQFQFGGPSAEFDTILRGLFVYPDFRMAFEINEDSLLSSEFVQYADSIIDEP